MESHDSSHFIRKKTASHTSCCTQKIKKNILMANHSFQKKSFKLQPPQEKFHLYTETAGISSELSIMA